MKTLRKICEGTEFKVIDDAINKSIENTKDLDIGSLSKTTYNNFRRSYNKLSNEAKEYLNFDSLYKVNPKLKELVGKKGSYDDIGYSYYVLPLLISRFRKTLNISDNILMEIVNFLTKYYYRFKIANQVIFSKNPININDVDKPVSYYFQGNLESQLKYVDILKEENERDNETRIDISSEFIEYLYLISEHNN